MILWNFDPKRKQTLPYYTLCLIYKMGNEEAINQLNMYFEREKKLKKEKKIKKTRKLVSNNLQGACANALCGFVWEPMMDGFV